jgi:hypothetical protein
MRHAEQSRRDMAPGSDPNRPLTAPTSSSQDKKARPAPLLHRRRSWSTRIAEVRPAGSSGQQEIWTPNTPPRFTQPSPLQPARFALPHRTRCHPSRRHPPSPHDETMSHCHPPVQSPTSHCRITDSVQWIPGDNAGEGRRRTRGQRASSAARGNCPQLGRIRTSEDLSERGPLVLRLPSPGYPEVLLERETGFEPATLSLEG